MATPTNKTTLRKLRQFVSSYEATKGRRPSQQAVEAFIEADLSARYSQMGTERERESLIRSREEDAGIRRQEIAAQKKANAVSGIASLGTTAVAGYGAYKQFASPSAPKSENNVDSPGYISKAVRAIRGERTPGDTANAFDESGQFTDEYMTTPGGERIAAPSGSTGLEMPGYTPGSLTSTGESLSAPQAASYSLDVGSSAFNMTPTKVSSPYSLEGVDMGMFSGGSTSSAAPATAGASSAGATISPGGAALAVGAGLQGIESMRKAQGEGWGSTPGSVAAKGATKLTPWNDDSTVGKVLNAMNPITAAVGVVNMVENTVKSVTGGSVICTELYCQGYIPYRVLQLDGKHRERYIDLNTYEGYLRWAPHVVRLMQRSVLFTKLVAPIGKAWAYEMASRLDSSIPGSCFGKILMKVGVPICRWLGRS